MTSHDVKELHTVAHCSPRSSTKSILLLLQQLGIGSYGCGSGCSRDGGILRTNQRCAAADERKALGTKHILWLHTFVLYVCYKYLSYDLHSLRESPKVGKLASDAFPPWRLRPRVLGFVGAGRLPLCHLSHSWCCDAIEGGVHCSRAWKGLRGMGWLKGFSENVQTIKSWIEVWTHGIIIIIIIFLYSMLQNLQKENPGCLIGARKIHLKELKEQIQIMIEAINMTWLPLQSNSCIEPQKHIHPKWRDH